MRRVRRRVHWGNVLVAAFLAWCGVYVLGWLYWHMYARLWGPSGAWVVTALVWVGLPVAWALGRAQRGPCLGCRDRDEDLAYFRRLAVDLSRERRAIIAAHLMFGNRQTSDEDTFDSPDQAT